MIVYNIISPDGFPISPEPHTIPIEDFAEDSKYQTDLFVKRFQRQGYYSKANGEHIDIADIADECNVLILEQT